MCTAFYFCSTLPFLQLLSDSSQLALPVSQDKFNGPTSDIEPRLEEFQSRRARVKKLSEEAFKCCHDLISRLKDASKSAQSAKVLIDYTVSIEMIRQRLERGRGEEVRVWEVCQRRENRWNLTIRLNQLEPDAEKVRDKKSIIVTVCVVCMYAYSVA